MGTDENGHDRNRIVRQPIVQVTAGMVGAVVAISAYLRGEYLLGSGYGLTCALASVGLLWLVVRSFPVAGRPSRIRVLAVGILSLVIGYALAYPASVNPDMQHFIDMQAIERAARAELTAVFTADPAFGNLIISTGHRKVVGVEVSGSLAYRVDFDRLRRRIAAECPTLSRCVLHWKIQLRADGTSIDEVDHYPFPSEKVGAQSSHPTLCGSRTCKSTGIGNERTSVRSQQVAKNLQERDSERGDSRCHGRTCLVVGCG